MAKEPDDLVRELLRGMRAGMTSMQREMRHARGDLPEVRRILDDHILGFDFLDEGAEMPREGTLTAIGFAVNTGRLQTKLERQVSELSKRVEKLEKAK